MKRGTIWLILLASPLLLLLPGCDKKDAFKSDDLTAYWNLQPGKFVRYRLDSLLFINFGQKDTIVTYQAKDVVDAPFTDENGRKGWRVIRYLRDFNSTSESDWKANIAYQVITERNTIEVQEDNLRFRKLSLPITEGYTWLGNSLLPIHPYQARYQFSNDGDIASWDYTYQDVGLSAQVGTQNYENTITVWQAGDSVNVPVTVPRAIGYRDHWVEQYAKDIGLIYKEVVMWEYQPANGSSPSYRSGFGIKMEIIDHN